jgi:chromosome segregation ATPase
MAERSKRGAQAATNGSDGNKVSAALTKITSGIEELRRDTDGLQAYAKLCEAQAALKQDLERKKNDMKKKDEELRGLAKQKDEEIAALQKSISASQEFQQRLHQTYEARIRTWDAESKRHSTDLAQISELKRELETFHKAAEDANNQNQQLRSTLDRHTQQSGELERRFSSLKNRLQMKQLELEETQSELETCQKGFQKTKDDLGILQLDLHEL